MTAPYTKIWFQRGNSKMNKRTPSQHNHGNVSQSISRQHNHGNVQLRICSLACSPFSSHSYSALQGYGNGLVLIAASQKELYKSLVFRGIRDFVSCLSFGTPLCSHTTCAILGTISQQEYIHSSQTRKHHHQPCVPGFNQFESKS